MEASYSIVQQEDEYRILLTPVNISAFPEQLQKKLVDRNIDISELIIDRISGESTTSQSVLHDITGWVADLFSSNPNLIIYYSCDDINPIPSRNTTSENRDIPVNEYRSRLFTHIFDSYMSSHMVSGVTNTPIRLDNYVDGNGYSLFFHFIARDIHNDIVELLKDDIKEVSGK
ncbi:hypothetical protein SAMN02910409_1908 [Prevotellaceae bacterium HUN156]|nr:hypothetical protein SAMN02910409_1908 [Prevotellaceae bacterium HUN156]